MIAHPSDPQFAEWKSALSVSRKQSDRRPLAIARPRSHDEVVEIVQASGIRRVPLAIRSGGNSLSATFLRDNALTLDLRGLAASSYDPSTGILTVGPGVTVENCARTLAAVQCAAPIGHAPKIGLGGFLLAGGNGWNAIQWGHGSDAIVAATVVWADGTHSRITEEDGDIFRALKGGGPFFPGIVTSFELLTHPSPQKITRTAVTLTVDNPLELGAQLDQVLSELPPHTELTAFYRPRTSIDSDARLVVSATSFISGRAPDGFSALDSLGGGNSVRNTRRTIVHPSLSSVVDNLPTHPGEALFSHHLWTNASLADVLSRLPSSSIGLGPCSSILMSTSPPNPTSSIYKPHGRVSVSTYAHWAPDTDDTDFHVEWARQSIDALSPITTGRYVGEADLTREINLSEYYTTDSIRVLTQTWTDTDPTTRFLRPPRI